MRNDLASLYSLAHDYYLNPNSYSSRAKSYDIKGAFYVAFIGTLMPADNTNRDMQYVSKRLGVPRDKLVTVGLNFLVNVLFTDSRTHYEILGVSKNESPAVIKKQYRLLIALFHPDKCASRNLDPEFYSAFLNGAYNVLKNEASRKAYDKTLEQQLQLERRGVSSGSAHKPSRKTAVSTGFSFSSLMSGFPIIYRYPRLIVWGVLISGFALMIVLSMREQPLQHQHPGKKLAARPAVATDQLQTVPLLKDGALVASPADISDRAYIDATINSEQLESMLNGDQANPVVSYAEPVVAQHSDNGAPSTDPVADGIEQGTYNAPALQPLTSQSKLHDVAPDQPQNTAYMEAPGDLEIQPMTRSADAVDQASLSTNISKHDEKRVATRDMTDVPAKRTEIVSDAVAIVRTDDQFADIDSDARPVKQSKLDLPTASIYMPPVKTAPEQSGFDGGKIGTDSISKSSMSKSSPDGAALLSAYPQPPEWAVMQFVQSYEAGDLDAMVRLFMKDVRTNYGEGRQQLVEQFANLFDNTTHRQIEIKQLVVEPISTRESLLVSDIEASIKRANETSPRYYAGEIHFRVIPGVSGLQIAEMTHNVR